MGIFGGTLSPHGRAGPGLGGVCPHHGPSVPPQPNDPVTNICQAADKQLFTLVEWAKRIPHVSELPLDDQVILLRAGEWPAWQAGGQPSWGSLSPPL